MWIVMVVCNSVLSLTFAAFAFDAAKNGRKREIAKRRAAELDEAEMDVKEAELIARQRRIDEENKKERQH